MSFDQKQIVSILTEVLKEHDVLITVDKGLVSVSQKDFKVEYPHYRKDIRKFSILDIYLLCHLYEVDDKSGVIHHAIKKLLASGKRGSKNANKDKLEVLVTLLRGYELDGLLTTEGSFEEGELTIIINETQMENMKVDKVKEQK